MVGLVDCNSFYASCERIFRPDLCGRPIAVLSNNDGCVVALSSDLKELGIRRGAPYFEVREQLSSCGAAVFSSNYTLYQDISDRVMSVIGSFGEPVEVYSIDEAFIFPSPQSCDALLELGRKIRREVMLETGVPVSIGFGRTKTLAKIAGKRAKYDPEGLYLLEEQDERSVLEATNIIDLWGIGPRKARYLYTQGVRNALEFMQLDDGWVRRNLTIVTLRTVWELRGESSIARDIEPAAKQGILSSLGFSMGVEDLYTLETALAGYASMAVDKLLAQGSETSRVTVFLQTHRYKDDFYSNSISRDLRVPTGYLPDILSAAVGCLHVIYIEGKSYAKVGIYLTEITDLSRKQLLLYDDGSDKRRAASAAVQGIRQRFGKDMLRCRNVSAPQEWEMQRNMLSRCYTTRWEDLPCVR